MDRAAFREQVEAALARVRDVVQLRVMSLGTVMVPDAPRDERGWALARALLRGIEDLHPQSDSVDEWTRRRYDLLSLRYVTGLSPEQVAERLAISRRHFYRQLQRALDEFSEYLWCGVNGVAQGADKVTRAEDVDEALASNSTEGADAAAPRDRLRMLRRESAKQLYANQTTLLGPVLADAVAVVSPILDKRGISLSTDIYAQLPQTAMSAELLKQLLLGMLSELLRDPGVCAIRVEAGVVSQEIAVTFVAERRGKLDMFPEMAHDLSERAFVTLASLQRARVAAVEKSADRTECRLFLPLASARTVLVVDDNEDVCALLRRYLVSEGFGVLIANTGAQAMELARSHDLDAITLDLMMNQEDGWDVLQTLTHDPETAHLPIIVCSVLDQRDLALMLGASEFVKKPVMKETLVRALALLIESPSVVSGQNL